MLSLGLLLTAALVSSVSATVYTTAPVASTVCTGGETCEIAWADDANAPALATVGLSSVGLWVGSVNNQVLLQEFATVDVSTQASLSVTIDPAVGESSSEYFVRFVSAAYVDPDSKYDALYSAYSAKFSLTGMTGSFNETVQAAIAAAAATTATSSAAAARSSTLVKSSSASQTASPTAKNAAVNATASAVSGSANTTSAAAPLLERSTVLLPVALVAASLFFAA